jgi:hypothetical protein
MQGIHGDTNIITVYDDAVPIRELTEDTLVYCWDKDTKLPSVGIMENPRLIGNSELLEIEFDSGLKVKCTPEHSFYSFRGDKIPAKDLVIEQSIRAFSMSLHRDGHYRVHGWVNGKARHQYVSRMVWEYFNGEIEDGLILHHKDMDKLNNRLENFQLLTNSEHNSIHYDERRAKGFGRRNHKIISINQISGLHEIYNGSIDTYIIADPVPVAGCSSGIVSCG